ncbi:alpha/beta fold hydrolase [Bdellovibrio bacteriovorus]|uniref:AMP-ligase n=1 Tax=Bdellovibrio bacteriovorus str. Tiberius TaxID=1069642 RepID=K7YS75_BDEBC|nr:alpha/beta fold hydrolase [Bdellovibrio bacteriovorus]AFY02756.1 AMP-ligase [Bdellovibrio bacteriovorus str. Tiberius]
MKTIIALHGNPGHPEDWSLLQKSLDPNAYRLLAVEADSEEWIRLLTQDKSKKILLGHSWGGYRILKSLPKYQDYVEQVVLVTPYIKPERPLSAVAKGLLQLPVLGDKLIQSSHTKSKDGFFADLIHPLKADALPYLAKVQERLQDWKLWQKTVSNKMKMEAHPWSAGDVCKVPVTVIYGRQDKISQDQAQNEIVSKYPSHKIVHVDNAGHGLLWSHVQDILKILTTEASSSASTPDSKIGYYPGEDGRNNVITYMEKHLREFPERVALRWANPQALAQWNGDPKTPIKHDEITYRHFAARINSFARGLMDIGIKKGDRVIIFLPMSLDMYTAMFAVQRIGAIAVFLDSWARSHHLGASAECVGPKAMISFKMAFDLVEQVPEFKSMPIRVLYGPGDKFTHKFEELLKAEPSPIEPVESEFTALITFTTGSTGKPKGANRTHRFLSAQHHALSHVIPYTEKDKDMPAFPIFSLNNLASGVTTILPALNLAAPAAHDSALLACQIMHENINCTTLSPSMLVGVAKFCKENNIQLTGLRRVVTGGAPISKDDVKAFYEIAPQTDLWILYGSTEAEPMAHIEGRDMLKESNITDPEIIEEGVNVGHISEDIDYRFIRIKDGPIELKDAPWSQIEVANGEVGEFICTGDHVCRDYYNNPEAFKTTKIMDEKNRVWHRTGDLAYIDPDKNLWIVGRVNNAIERAGRYYFPVRAEVLLKRMDFTYRCAFLGMDDAKLGQATYAVVELKEGIDAAIFDFAAAKKEIQRVFEKNKIPVDEIKFVNKVPMDPRHHSKVEYKVLRDQLKEPGVVIG